MLNINIPALTHVHPESGGQGNLQDHVSVGEGGKKGEAERKVCLSVSLHFYFRIYRARVQRNMVSGRETRPMKGERLLLVWALRFGHEFLEVTRSDFDIFSGDRTNLECCGSAVTGK